VTKTGVQKGLILILMAAAIAVAVYFGYLNRKPSTSEDPVTVTEVQDILLLDLENHYPPTARETVMNFCRIYKALYGESATADQIAAMGDQLLVLYDQELIDHQFDYQGSLLQEVNRKKADGYTITNYHVQSAEEIETGYVEGHDISYVKCMITMRKGSQLNATNYLFVLRLEESSGRWKIYGWTPASDDA
jgi:hypothetical protein